MIKHDEHLRTRRKCRKHETQASVFYISQVFSNVRIVLSQCNTQLMRFHFLYDIEVIWGKVKTKTKRFFYVLYSGETWAFDQSEREPGPIYIINLIKYFGENS